LRRLESQQVKEEEKEESESDTESEEDEVFKYRLINVTDNSIKPEDDDEEAKRRMNDEMKGLMCGTSMDEPLFLDDTASEESDEDLTKSRVLNSSGSHNTLANPEPSTSTSDITCKVCTTLHSPPIPVCCESCNNVLQPDKFPKNKTWICRVSGCHGSDVGYVNFEDAGRCGLCGAKRSST
jgi:hypothetical protein